VNLPKALAALRHRDFRVYWIGQAVSLVGTWMQQMAQGWVVTGLSKDAFVLGGLAVAGSLPILLLSMRAGVMADKMDKRRILIATQAGLMLLAFAFAALLFSGRLALWHVFVMAALLGVVTAFDLPAAQALPPELVDPPDIPNAVALMQQVFHGARLVGPALAGVLMARFGNGAAFVGNGVSFLAVIVSLLMIKSRGSAIDRYETQQALREAAAGPAPLGAVGAAAGTGAGAGAGTGRPKRGGGGIGEGIAYLRGEPVVRSLVLLSALATALVFPFVAILMVYYVRHVLGTDDAATMGTLMSTSGLASLVGAIAIAWGAARNRRWWLVGSVAGATVALLGQAQVHTWRAALPLVALMSFSISSLMGRISQMIQERVPGQLRGRVMALFAISFTGIMPFAALLLAWLADRMSYTRIMTVGGGLFLVSGLALLMGAWKPLGEPVAVAGGGQPAPATE